MAKEGSELGLPIISEIRGMLCEQDFKCAITGRALEPENTTGDHIIPLSRKALKPAAGPENVWLVDKSVNKLKSNLTYEELLQLAKEIVANEKKARHLISKKAEGSTLKLDKNEFSDVVNLRN